MIGLILIDFSAIRDYSWLLGVNFFGKYCLIYFTHILVLVDSGKITLNSITSFCPEAKV